MSPKSTLHTGVSNAALEQAARTGKTPEELEAEEAAAQQDAGESEDGQQEETADTTAPEPDTEPKDDPERPSRPAVNAPKSDWLAYVIARGTPEADANAMTKDQLIAAYQD